MVYVQRGPTGNVVGVFSNSQAGYAEEEISATDTAVIAFLAGRRLVPKSLIISRLTDAQLDAALAAMNNRQKERWRAPDKPSVYADDPDVLAVIQAVGADPAVILAAE